MVPRFQLHGPSSFEQGCWSTKDTGARRSTHCGSPRCLSVALRAGAREEAPPSMQEHWQRLDAAPSAGRCPVDSAAPSLSSMESPNASSTWPKFRCMGWSKSAARCWNMRSQATVCCTKPRLLEHSGLVGSGHSRNSLSCHAEKSCATPFVTHVRPRWSSESGCEEGGVPQGHDRCGPIRAQASGDGLTISFDFDRVVRGGSRDPGAVEWLARSGPGSASAPRGSRARGNCPEGGRHRKSFLLARK